MLKHVEHPAPFRRKAIPDRVKLHAALRKLGLRAEDVEYDHQPALAMRPINPETGDTIPPQNDPEHIFLVTVDEHREKTFGKGGTKRVTTAGSDIGNIAKTKRVAREQEEFRQRLLAKEPGAERQKKTRMPTRPLAKRRTTK